jgi:hypothetical protein
VGRSVRGRCPRAGGEPDTAAVAQVGAVLTGQGSRVSIGLPRPPAVDRWSQTVNTFFRWRLQLSRIVSLKGVTDVHPCPIEVQDEAETNEMATLKGRTA